MKKERQGLVRVSAALLTILLLACTITAQDVALPRDSGIAGHVLRNSGDRFVIHVDEAQQDVDFSGDGETHDSIVVEYDSRSEDAFSERSCPRDQNLLPMPSAFIRKIVSLPSTQIR